LNIKGLKAIIIETFGSGNAPTESWFIEALKKTIAKGIIVYNVTQCNGGSVIQGKYETSKGLQKIGVVSGFDITLEAAVCKLMYLLGKGYPIAKTKSLLTKNLRGEITV